LNPAIALIVAIIGGGTGLGGLFVTLIKTLGSSSNKSAELRQALNLQIDERVKVQLKEAWDRIDALEDQIKDLQDSETKTKRENNQIKVAVKRYFRDLVDWNRNGRKGTMPLPSQADLDLLELDPNERSLSRAEIQSLQKDGV